MLGISATDRANLRHSLTMSSERLDGFLLVGAIAALMWLSEILDTVLGHRLDRYGIVPRTDEGLAGIAASPFLHLGFGHLAANTLPFVAMGAVIAAGGLRRVAVVTVVVAIVGGFGTWLFTPAGTTVIGASGIVFGYAAYLLARGFFTGAASHFLIGVVVIVIWGGALLGGLVPQEGISWQAHFFGAVGGVLAAALVGSAAGRRPPTRAV
jgi:membrane associated rhomboid family serine protease